MSLTELRMRLEGRRNELRALRIAVLAGGGSSEREVSLRSGRAALGALAAAGYSAELLLLGADSLSLEATEFAEAIAVRENTAVRDIGDSSLQPAGSSDSSALSAIRQSGIVLLMLHGSHGENGAWQGLLELAGVPYVSAGVKGSALAIDKLISKRLFEQMGIPTPQWWTYGRGTAQPDVPSAVSELVAKPPLEGSSVGIEIVPNDADGWGRIENLARRFDSLLIEERILGRELTVGIIGQSNDPIALPIVEILARGEFYDYESKYGGGSRYECPAKLEPQVAAQISGYAQSIYRNFELGPFARVDCILAQDGVPYFLEANTLPGFTELSLLPMAARAAGIEMGELLELLLLCALERHEAQQEGRG